MSDIEHSQRVHCQELNSGKHFTGFLFIDDKTITAELFGYDAHIFLDCEKEPVFLRTSDNHVVSLHSNIEASLGTSSRPRKRMVVHHQKIISGVAVVGPDRWSEVDRIRNVTFKVERTKSILRHREKTQLLSRTNRKQSSDARELFKVKICGMAISVRYGGRYSFEHDYPIETWPYIEIQFDEGPLLSEYLDFVICIVRLFSASLGAYLQPSDIKICRLSEDELIAAIENNQFDEFHSVEYIWPKVKVDEIRTWHGNSFILAYDDIELSALKECVSAWVGRLSEWRKAYSLMMECLMLADEISPTRLMAAWRWFEEIPGTEVTPVITEAHIEKISEAASSKAKELGYQNIQNRVVGVLKRIGTETNSERFDRLVATVRVKFGPGICDDEISEHLVRAVAFRGRVAHGHFGSESNSEFKLFAKSIYALEALCFLLTIRDLPMCQAGAGRVGGNPLVSNYKHSY